MAEDSSRTVESNGAAGFVVRGSRFRGLIAPAAQLAAAEAVIDEVAEKHPDATHVVPAYWLREDPIREWSSDDGEPAGSAGSPVLSVLQDEHLVNGVAVVVRQYGGTNLGIGGLVRAYREAASRALAATTVIERRETRSLRIETAYDDSGTVRSIIESTGLTFDAEYGETVTFDVRVPLTEVDDIRDRLLSATSGRTTIRAP